MCCNPVSATLSLTTTNALQVGGAVDPANCSVPNTAGAPTKIGDVCISPFAVNWNCRLGSFDDACASYPNQCGAPGYEVGPEVSSLFGQCFFDMYNQADLALSDELIAAAKAPAATNAAGLSYPTPASYLTSYSSSYWGIQSNASSAAFMTTPSLMTTTPNVWDYNVCAETDSQYFWTSLPWDYLARSYISMTINDALNASTAASNVLAVSAEEGVGFLAAMYKYANMTGGRMIPHTIIRSNSDYTYLPVDFDGLGFWSQSTDLDDVDFSQSYVFAIANMSAAVLKMLQTRCVAANGAASTLCTMASGQGVTYSG